MAKPNGIALILGGKPKMKAPPESEPDMDAGDEEGDDADMSDVDEKAKEPAMEFIDACKSGDPTKLWEAFSALHRLEHVKMDKEDEGDEDTEEEK